MLTGETIHVGPEVDRDPASFTLPQFGIFAQGTPAHHFLELDLKPGVMPEQAVSAFRELRTPTCRPAGRTSFSRSAPASGRRWLPTCSRTTSGPSNP